VPIKNVCYLSTTSGEEISWEVYEQQIERPVGECLTRRKCCTLSLPWECRLKSTAEASGMLSERNSVDSELALLYSKLKGVKYQRAAEGLPIPSS
jgi:hypothetical protein